jgi:hypothetical protein
LPIRQRYVPSLQRTRTFLVDHLGTAGRDLLDRGAQRAGIVRVHELQERAGEDLLLGPAQQPLVARAHPPEVPVEPGNEDERERKSEQLRVLLLRGPPLDDVDRVAEECLGDAGVVVLDVGSGVKPAIRVVFFDDLAALRPDGHVVNLAPNSVAPARAA